MFFSPPIFTLILFLLKMCIISVYSLDWPCYLLLSNLQPNLLRLTAEEWHHHDLLFHFSEHLPSLFSLRSSPPLLHSNIYCLVGMNFLLLSCTLCPFLLSNCNPYFFLCLWEHKTLWIQSSLSGQLSSFAMCCLRCRSLKKYIYLFILALRNNLKWILKVFVFTCLIPVSSWNKKRKEN